MLTMCGGLAPSRRFCTAMRPPNVALVLSQAARRMAAPGAAALAPSASRIASLSSLFTPGAAQLLAPLDGAGCTVDSEPVLYADNPNSLRKVTQSVLL